MTRRSRAASRTSPPARKSVEAGSAGLPPNEAREGRSPDRGWSRFDAEALYAHSIVLHAIGDTEGCIDALRSSLEILPTYAPAILSVGSVEYQLGRREEGLDLFLSLVGLPEDTEELHEIIDQAGDFLISVGDYTDGLSLYQAAAARFPDVGVFHQGVGCCAGHEGLHEEAVAASEAALELEPGSQEFVNDLGWTLYLGGRLAEGREVLRRAVAMNPTDELAAENLRICEQVLRRSTPAKSRRRRAGTGGATASSGGPPHFT